MLLSGYPNVEVVVACRSCPRRGRYRLARLAVRYGSEISLLDLLGKLAADCPKQQPPTPGGLVNVYAHCGVHFPNLGQLVAEGMGTKPRHHGKGQDRR